MRTRVAVASVLLAAAGLAPAAETTLRDRLPPEVRKSGVLRFVGDSHPPYRILSDDRRIREGIDADLAHALEPLLGVRIEHHVVNSLSATLAGLEAGRYDVAMGPALGTKERQLRFDVITWLTTRPSFVYPTRPLTGSPRSYLKVDDLCGVKITYVAGSVTERVTDRIGARCEKAGKPRPQHVPLVDTNMTLVAVQAGRADMAGMTLTAALHAVHINKDAEGDLFRFFSDDGQVLGIDTLGLFVSKRSGLGPVMLAAMEGLFQSGEYARIMAKWGVSAVSVDAPRLNAATK